MWKFWEKDPEIEVERDACEEIRLNTRGADEEALIRTREKLFEECVENEPKPGERPSSKFQSAITRLGTLDYELEKMREQKGEERRHRGRAGRSRGRWRSRRRGSPGTAGTALVSLFPAAMADGCHYGIHCVPLRR